MIDKIEIQEAGGSSRTEPIGTSASLVSYNPAQSGLSATNTQDAIDEAAVAIGTEATRAGNAESTLNTAIGNETTRAQEAERTLSGQINNINGKIGTANGIAELDSSGKVPSSQLPGFVDDVVEGYYNTADSKFYADAAHTTEIAGETGKIYVSLDTNYEYRWSGSAFIRVNEGVILGETSSTAYRGDRGRIAYEHSQSTGGNPHGVTAAEVGLGNVPNVSTNDQTPTFTQASARANITSGENMTTLFGKIKKFFADLKTVAFTGSYSDLSNKPTIPTKTSQLQNDSNYITAGDVPDAGVTSFNGRSGSVSPKSGDYTASMVGLGNVPNVSTNDQTPTFTQASARANIASGETVATLFGKIMKYFADLKTVAFTGSYSDLSNKPTIPTAVTVDSSLSTISTNPVRNSVVTTSLNSKASAPTILTASLDVNVTSLSFTNSAIGANTRIDCYSSVDGISPESKAVSGNTLTLTFSDSHDAATIMVRLEN